MAGCCEYGDEPSDSMKGGEFLEYVSDYKLLKKHSAPRRYSVRQTTVIQALS